MFGLPDIKAYRLSISSWGQESAYRLKGLFELSLHSCREFTDADFTICCDVEVSHNLIYIIVEFLEEVVHNQLMSIQILVFRKVDSQAF